MASTQHKQHQVAADKLSEQLRELKDEDNFGDAGDCLWRYPVFESRELTETERDLRDWGYVFGLAFGLAIGANPGMPHAAAAELCVLARSQGLHRVERRDRGSSRQA